MTTQEHATKAFFTDSQFQLMKSVLDRIIPFDGTRPGAGELGIGYNLDGVVAKSTGLRRLFADGIPEIEIKARSGYSNEFANLSNNQKDAVLREIETDEPEFFNQLVRQTYNGYYTNPTIIELCGLEARPPQHKGHQIDSGNLSLIENVKKRGRVYKDVE